MNKKDTGPKETDERKLALLACYKNAQKLIEFGNTITQFPKGKDGSHFSGGFKEYKGELHGSFYYRKPVSIWSPHTKTGLGFFEIIVSPKNSICYFLLNTLDPKPLRPYRTNDCAAILLKFLEWAGLVDAEFDSKLSHTIEKEKNKGERVTLVVHATAQSNKIAIKALVNDFMSAGKIKNVIQAPEGINAYWATGLINQNNPVTKKDLARCIDLGATVIQQNISPKIR